MTEIVRAIIRISGIVQMVGFRYFTRQKAISYGLTGYVRNNIDGSVEVEAEGEKGLIQDFIKELKVGPPAAHVTTLKVDWLEYRGDFRNFTIKY
ncbi:acylphosphatase [bacterium]|nr:acylphosphatase [bacterium]